MISRIMKNLDVIAISSIVIILAVVGRMFGNLGMSWYDSLTLPVLTPPHWVFGFVWTTLYIFIAWALVILVRGYKHIGYYFTILGLFMLLAILNPLWSYLFFIEHSSAAALLDAIVMEFTLLTIILYVWDDARAIALLLIPAAVWVVFAMYLNYQILMLN